eukprot:gene6009-6707_t
MDMSPMKPGVPGMPMPPTEGYSVHKTNPGEIDIPNRVFVKGFPRETSEEDLKAYFEEYGMVHESKIVKDKTGISKGYAFITFDSQDIAEKVKLLGNVDFNGREIVLGPARVRKKRNSLFKRPDQLWQSVVPGGVQQPVYYSVSQDGVWYFQPPVQQVLSVVQPNQVQSYGQANCWPSAQYQAPQTAYAQGQQFPYNPTTQVSNAYPVGNVADIFKVARKPAGMVSMTPPESPEYTLANPNNCSPVQCVPVYEGNLIGEDTYASHNPQQERFHISSAQNIVMIDPTDRKLKRVIMKREPQQTGRLVPANPCTMCNGPGIPTVSVNTNTTMTHDV